MSGGPMRVGEAMPGGDEELLLGFDTSAPVGSVALARGRRVLARVFLDRAEEHAARLVPAIAEALERVGATRADVAGIVVGNGPGSFTGVRIAAATARGLALALELPVWPRSSLAAAAASYRAPFPGEGGGAHLPSTGGLPREAEGWPRYVLLDARGRRVYGACYRFLPDRMETLVPPHAGTLDEVVESDLPGNVLLCGSAAIRHAALLEARGLSVLPPPAGYPTAEGLFRVHRLDPAAPAAPDDPWEPEYLRSSSARPLLRPAGGKGS